MEELDLVFVIDETGTNKIRVTDLGSMGEVIAQVKKTVVEICNTVSKTFPNLNSALVHTKSINSKM
jgi:hypothetical protein